MPSNQSSAVAFFKCIRDRVSRAPLHCYCELQNLANGEYDKKKVEAAERSLREAEALAANLDDADRQIVTKIVQSVMNLRCSRNVDEHG